MSVGSYDPGAREKAISEAAVRELLGAAAALRAPDFGLSAERIEALAGLARHEDGCDWAAAAAGLSSAELESLVRLYTLAERLPGWNAGPRSPVIPLVAELKRRDACPDGLTAWIKANTDNRFLPYGSLLDRL